LRAIFEDGCSEAVRSTVVSLQMLYIIRIKLAEVALFDRNLRNYFIHQLVYILRGQSYVKVAWFQLPSNYKKFTECSEDGVKKKHQFSSGH